MFEYSLDLQYLVKENAIKGGIETEITGRRCVSHFPNFTLYNDLPIYFLNKNINKMFDIIKNIK